MEIKYYEFKSLLVLSSFGELMRSTPKSLQRQTNLGEAPQCLIEAV